MNTLTKLLLSGLISLGVITGVYAHNVQSISLDEAKKIALENIDGHIQDAQEDGDDYEITIEKDQTIYDIEIDKTSGEVKEINQEDRETSSQAMTLEEAKQLALKEVNGKIISTKSDSDDYEITIEKDDYIYEIEIDKTTGKMTDIEKEKKTTSKITLEEAKQLALKEVNGKIISTKSDSDEYEITIEKDAYIYEIEVNKNTGTITDIDKDKQKTTTINISKAKAQDIALKQMNGKVVKVEYDQEDGEYSVEIVKNHIEYEVSIDADNGKVLKVEKD